MVRNRSRRWARPLVEALDARLLLKTIYVDAGGPAGNGLSWSFPMQSLQQALGFAAPGDQIRVADGVYKPTTTGDRNATFQLKFGVTMLGGFAGHSAQFPDARDIVSNPTILSGDIGTIGTASDNSYNVVTATNVNSTAQLDGFTITGGYANGTSANANRGGGVLIFNASPTISNCTITQNRATSFGEGMSITGTQANPQATAPAIIDCRFESNGDFNSTTGFSYGGAIFNEYSSPVITNSEFVGNATTLGGGAIHSRTSNTTINGCVFQGNRGRYGGSAITNEDGWLWVTNTEFAENVNEIQGTVRNIGSQSLATAQFTNCIFRDNTGGTGGAIFNENATLTADHCTFLRNTSQRNGGAVWSWLGRVNLTNSKFYGNSTGISGGGALTTSATSQSHAAFIVNCEFVGNRAPRGGAILDQGAYGSAIRNSTFIANAATTSGGAIEITNGTSAPLYLANSILWNNTAPTGAQIAVTGQGVAPTVYFCNVQGQPTNAINISADPLFVRNPQLGDDAAWGTIDDDYGDLRLQMQSPCVDAGAASAVAQNYPLDIAGNPRFFDFPGVGISRPAPDMGAHELNLRLGLLRVAEGETLVLPTGGHTFVIEQFVLGNGATLDVADAALILLDSSLPAVQSLITQGFNNGDWLGSGLTSSAAAADPNGLTALGYLDNAELGATEFAGVTGLTGNEILIKYTYYGDADLSGHVTLDDFNQFLYGYQNPGVERTWLNGDFDFSGAVTLDDFNQFLYGYQEQKEML